jgi:hypothetical protein
MCAPLPVVCGKHSVDIQTTADAQATWQRFSALRILV